MYKLVKLNKIANISTGFPFKGEKYSNEGIRVVRGENVTVGSLRWDSIKCWNEDFDQVDKYSLKDGDVVIGMDGSKVGKNRARVKRNDLPLLLAQRVALIRNNELSNQNFLYYLIRANRFEEYVERIQTGSSVPHISQKQIEEYPVPFISVDIQKKISDVLLSLDSKIELNNRINAELEAMAKTLYDYWFVQFDFPDKNGKSYKTSGGKMVWNEELKREIPEGWEVKSIDYYANVIDPHPSHRAPHEVLDGFPFAGIGDIDEYGNIDINKARVIDEEFVLKQERDYTINEYSIGYGRVGTVGKVVKLRKQPFRFALSPTMAIINPKNNLLPSFVYFTVTNPTFLQWVNKYTSGSTRPAIGIQHLRTIPVIKPKIYAQNLLEKFERIVESSFKQTDILNEENQKLTELRDWLLPMLMNGQMKVGDVGEEEILAMAAEPEVKYDKRKK